MSDDNETRDRQPEGRRPAWQSGTPRGQERVVSYDSDERYWTDYLRVALPVVGLLLMLGLLFWWANSIIGDEQGAEPTSTAESEIAEAATNTPQNTPEPGLDPTEVDLSPTPDEAAGGDGEDEGQPGEATEPADGAEETPAEEAPDEECDSPLARGQIVQITEEGSGARFRPEPSIEDGDFPELPTGTQLEIRGNCYETVEETNFWNVIVVEDGEGVEAGERGYVADQFLEPAPEE